MTKFVYKRFNTFITILYMLRALSCSSSGGQIVLIQHLVSSLLVSDRPVHSTGWLSHRSGRQPKTYVKPEAAITVFELLMMGGVSPETC